MQEANVATSTTTEAQPATSAQAHMQEAAHGVDLASHISALQKQVAELKSEAADRRIAAKTAAEEAAKKAAEAGDFRALADQYRAELDAMKPKLAILDEAQEFMTATAREIDSLKPTLPAYLQTAIDAASSLKAKREIVAQYQSTVTQRAAPIPAASPATSSRDLSLNDFASADDVRRVAQESPGAFRAMLDKFTNSGRPTSAIGAVLAARK